MNTHLQEDRSLVRRFNFLGFPNEKRGGLSYAALKAELGHERAAALVIRIGKLLEKQAGRQRGASLPEALGNIIGSLTPGERWSIAEGGVMPTRISGEGVP